MADSVTTTPPGGGTTPTTIQYFSDLHLEFGSMEFPHVETADCVVAAGDIAPGLDGLAWLGQSRRPVIYVAGNHEFYGYNLPRLREALREQTDFPHVHFLDNECLVLGTTRFLGTTLWTDFDAAETEEVAAFANLINDYTQIEMEPGVDLKPTDTLMLNFHATLWLEQCLSEPWDGQTVVVSHHAPTHRSWPRGRDLVYRPAYCNTLESLLSRHRVDAWIHGHVHAPSDYRVPGSRTRVVCNPRGYTGYQNLPNFAAERCISLE